MLKTISTATSGEIVETRYPGEQVRTHFRTGKQKGQSLVEFAMVMPMLLLVVTGLAAFGIYINHYIALTDAVSTGARLLAISRGQTTYPPVGGVPDPCALTVNAIEQAAPFMAPASMTFKFVLNTTIPASTYTTTSCSSASTNTGSSAYLVQGKPAQVSVTYPCNMAIYGKNLFPGCTFTAQTTEIVQ